MRRRGSGRCCSGRSRLNDTGQSPLSRATPALSMATSAPRVSSASTATVEEIGKATAGPKWFQMYLNVDQGISRELLQRVKPAGFKAVILTIDAIGQGSGPALAPHRQLSDRGAH